MLLARVSDAADAGIPDEQVARVSAEARHMAPGFTVAKFRSDALSRNPIYLSQRERFVAGLRRIGVPEE